MRLEGNMFARVTTNQVKPENLEAGIKSFRENVGTIGKNMVGFKGSYLLVDRKTGKMLGIALWDKKEDLEASAVIAAQIRSKIFHATETTTLPTVEIYEVAVQE
jgi:hypothetical protein